MSTANSTSLIAAFATMKSLSDEKKYRSPYQLLAEFIRNIITEKAIFSFQVTEMKNWLSEIFGFIIPEAVVKSTLRNMAGISKINGIYNVSSSDLGSDSLFIEKKKEAENANSETITLLIKYIQERTRETAIAKELLTQELVSYLMGESLASNKYSDLISEFILKNEKNCDIQAFLNSVKEGSVLYIGLNHNINETGSLTKPLTLYLGTEILFSIAGFNGTIHKQLADDFFNLVRTANSGKAKKINLCFFQEVKKEIDDFFSTAAEIIDGVKSQFVEKPAMGAIINGCKTPSDVVIKQADFYHKLQYGFGITEDLKTDFYDTEYFESNLESFDYVDDADKKKKKETSIKYISHINKLRNGQVFENDIDAEYLLITNTKATLLISEEQSNIICEEHGLEYVANFAISLDRITNLLWYKLGNGFGNKEYPVNIDAILEARIVLSASIAKSASQAYFDIKKQYESEIISKDQLAGRIIALKKKPKLPEELQEEKIVEIMDFSPEFLSRYEEEHHINQIALEEKEYLLTDLKNETDAQISAKNITIAEQAKEIKEKDKSISEKNDTIATQSDRIKAQDEELEKYRKKEREDKEKKEHIKNIWLFVWSIAWKIVIVVVVVFGSILLCNRINSNYSSAIGIILGVLSLIPSVLSIVTKDYRKCFPKKTNEKTVSEEDV